MFKSIINFVVSEIPYGGIIALPQVMSEMVSDFSESEIRDLKKELNERYLGKNVSVDFLSGHNGVVIGTVVFIK